MRNRLSSYTYLNANRLMKSHVHIHVIIPRSQKFANTHLLSVEGAKLSVHTRRSSPKTVNSNVFTAKGANSDTKRESSMSIDHSDAEI